MPSPVNSPLPPVALWRVNTMRLLFALMALVMGSVVWRQLLFESDGWSWERGLAKSMLAALALLSLIGVRYPLQMLPLMLYEIAWKSVWLLAIALPAWLSAQWTDDIGSLFQDCIGIVIAFFIVPWRYVWAKFFVQPMEPLRTKA